MRSAYALMRSVSNLASMIGLAKVPRPKCDRRMFQVTCEVKAGIADKFEIIGILLRAGHNEISQGLQRRVGTGFQRGDVHVGKDRSIGRQDRQEIKKARCPSGAWAGQRARVQIDNNGDNRKDSEQSGHDEDFVLAVRGHRITSDLSRDECRFFLYLAQYKSGPGMRWWKAQPADNSALRKE